MILNHVFYVWQELKGGKAYAKVSEWPLTLLECVIYKLKN